MSKTIHRAGLLLTLAYAWLAAGPRTQAQTPPWEHKERNPSHVLLPGGRPEVPEDWLARRLRDTRERNGAFDMARQIIQDPEKFGITRADLVRMARRIHDRGGLNNLNPNDPNLKKLFQEARKNLTPEQAASLQRLVPDQAQAGPPVAVGTPPVPNGDGPAEKDGPGRKDKDGPDVRDKDGDKDRPKDERNPPPPSPAPPPASPKPAEKNWLERQLDQLREEGGLAGEMRNVLKDLTGPGTRIGDYARGMTREARRLGGQLMPRVSDLAIGPMLRDVLPDLPPLSDVGGPPDLRLPNLPSGQGAASGVGGGLMVLAALFALGVVAWLLVVRPRLGGAGRDSWRPGPWPVQPAAVRTRSDVVRAFEHLALVLLGRRATTAHHLDIAGQMAAAPEDPTGRRRSAAAELAVLYEHARYAPPDEGLSDDEVETARRDLSFLAGAPVA